MTQEAAVVHAESENASTAHIVHALMQFVLAVRHRKNMVIMALMVSSLLGGLYYMTATRRFSATAGLLVLQIGNDPLSSMPTLENNWQQSLLPTYQSLIGKAEVIEAALDRLGREHRVDFAHRPRDEWSAIVQENLSVKNERRTNILELGYRSKDPNAAVAVVNAIVESYVDFMDKTYKGTADELKEVLTNKEREVNDRLAGLETEQRRLAREARDLRNTSDSQVLHPLVERAFAANKELIETRWQRQKLDICLAQIERAAALGEDLDPYVLSLEDLLGPEIHGRLGLAYDASLQGKLGQSLIENRAELEAMRHFRQPAHPDFAALEERIRVTEQGLLEHPEWVRQQTAGRLGPRLIAMVQQKLAEVRALEAWLQDDFKQTEEVAIEINDQLAALATIDGKIKWNRDLRELLAKQIENAELKHEGQEVTVEIVEEPTVDTTPVSPKLTTTILMVLLCGLGLGLGLVYVSDVLDDRFRSVEEMQALLRVPVLAMVRELDEIEEAAGIDAIQTCAAPNAAESEAFRTLRTALSFADHDTHQVVISSPEPGDGKTTVLANLAVAVAQAGKRTLLIDADLRRPGLTAMMGMRGIDGLSSVIRGSEDVVSMATAQIRPSGLENLDVLASGPRPTNPAELLGGQRFSELLAWAESVYDQVFIDSPPALATSDAAVIGRLVNGVMLVLQPAKNRRRLVIRCVEDFAVLKIPLLGVVVNRVGSEKDGSYYGYGYGGYYGHGYAYGYSRDSDEGEDELERADATTAHETVSGAGTGDHLRRDDAHPSGGIVPRRVARLRETHGPRE